MYRHDALRVVTGTPSQLSARAADIVRYVSEVVKSARVAFPTARLHSLQANAMSGRSDARYASLADTLC